MLQIEHRVLGVLKNLLLPGWAAGSQKRLKSDVELGPFERAWSGSVRLPALLRLKKCFVQNWNSPDPNFYSFHITQVMPGEMRQCKIRSSLERIKQIWGVLPWSSQWLENRPGWLVIAKGEFIGISSQGMNLVGHNVSTFITFIFQSLWCLSELVSQPEIPRTEQQKLAGHEFMSYTAQQWTLKTYHASQLSSLCWAPRNQTLQWIFPYGFPVYRWFSHFNALIRAVPSRPCLINKGYNQLNSFREIIFNPTCW